MAKVTKRVPVEKSKLFFVIPKTISVIPYPSNFLVSYNNNNNFIASIAHDT